MPISRTHLLNIDTKKYINRVNAFRKIGGVPPLERGDIVDIDNFVVGLKDLNVWEKFICWPMRSVHNTGFGNTIMSLGGRNIINCILLNSPEHSYNGIVTVSGAGMFGDIGSNAFNVILGSPPVRQWGIFTICYSGASSMGFWNGAHGANGVAGSIQIGLIYNSNSGTTGYYGAWVEGSWVTSSAVNLAGNGPALATCLRTSETAASYWKNGESRHSATSSPVSLHPIASGAKLLGNSRNFSTDTPTGVTACQGFFLGIIPQVSFYNLIKQSIGRNLNLP